MKTFCVRVEIVMRNWPVSNFERLKQLMVGNANIRVNPGVIYSRKTPADFHRRRCQEVAPLRKFELVVCDDVYGSNMTSPAITQCTVNRSWPQTRPHHLWCSSHSPISGSAMGKSHVVHRPPFLRRTPKSGIRTDLTQRWFPNTLGIFSYEGSLLILDEKQEPTRIHSPDVRMLITAFPFPGLAFIALYQVSAHARWSQGGRTHRPRWPLRTVWSKHNSHPKTTNSRIQLIWQYSVTVLWYNKVGRIYVWRGELN